MHRISRVWQPKVISRTLTLPLLRSYSSAIQPWKKTYPTTTVFANQATVTLTQTRHHTGEFYSKPGTYSTRETGHQKLWSQRNFHERSFTIGIGGPVGSGKTALLLALSLRLRDTIELGVVTNDIFTQEDAEFLVRKEALPKERIRAVETGGCPHAAIREDVSANLGALEKLTRDIRTELQLKDMEQVVESPLVTPLPLLLCESGGDNLAANFSRELADLTIYVIDVAGGDKIPRKGGPGITQSDVLVINKVDLADAVGADLGVMERDAVRMRGGDGYEGPIVMAAVKKGVGVEAIVGYILESFHLATGQDCGGVSHDHDHNHS
eukprot:CAMPEP_0194356936 /NCGR_PEP_ID=MMETSP0174-20130528/4494_1 /TAXON_ID=216777 /ORGANISM="Proboscia alata, Strain PI-D3" /LENGTH=323 /DNA_ID=CAMNT_0039126747 /DNA_START=105 /DNA_END=1076 /DNA_ORIENTATION=-